MKVTVIGGGKMGLPLACQMASRGADVTVCDTNQELVAKINSASCPFNEPGLAQLMESLVKRQPAPVADAATGSLRAVSDCAHAVRDAQVVIVIVPVLLTDDHDADTSIIEEVSRELARSMKPGTMVCYETTLPVGTTRRLARVLESAGLEAGKDFDLVFSPERVKSRLVFQRLTENPKVVGGLTPEAEERAAEFYARYLGAPVIRMGSLEASELVKLAGMIFRDVNIALANELSTYAELWGLDTKAVIEAANTDGETFLLHPGIGVGGHCTPVYPNFLLRDAERHGLDVSLTAIGRQINQTRPQYIVDQIEKTWQSLQDKRVTILGLGFRPGVKEHILSPSFALKEELAKRSAKVRLHDPMYTRREMEDLGFEPGEIPGSQVLILNTAHEQYQDLDFPELALHGLKLAVDGRNFWNPSQITASGVTYLGMGRGQIKGLDIDTASQQNLPLSRLHLTELDAAAAARAVRSGWIMQGPEVEAFESEFAEFVESPYACAVSSCTAGLIMALKALDIGEGDEVITVSHSFIATANSIVLSGATPVFADIDRDTLNIDASLIEPLITSATRAILCVHQLGMPCDMSAIMEIAGRYSLKVIEDAACALGSEVSLAGGFQQIGKPAGDIACFSFHPRKLLSTGDGGMVTTADTGLDARLRRLRNHGMTIPTSNRKTGSVYVREHYLEPAWNFRLSDIQAAVGREQLRRLPSLLDARRQCAENYRRLLAGRRGITLFTEPHYARTNWQSFAIRLEAAVERCRIIESMQARGIATRPGISCAHEEPAYTGRRWGCAGGTPSPCDHCSHLRESVKARDHCLILPMYPGLKAADQERITSALDQVLLELKQHS